jgi:hypothetical protein
MARVARSAGAIALASFEKFIAAVVRIGGRVCPGRSRHGRRVRLIASLRRLAPTALGAIVSSSQRTTSSLVLLSEVEAVEVV